jgi:hypothetical protein
MAYKRLMTLAVLAMLSGGCANTYSVVRQQKGDIPRLSITDTFCIAVNGTDITYGKRYDKNGALLSGVLQASLEEMGIIPGTENSYLRYYDALKSARAHDCDYIVYGEIVRWEDHSAVFDGVPNRAEVRISIIDTTKGKTVDTAVLSGESRRVYSGNPPQELLTIPVERYLSSMFEAGGDATR